MLVNVSICISTKITQISFGFLATIEIISFEERSIIFKGKASQKYIGVSPEGNIATYVSIYRLISLPYCASRAY